MGCGMECYCPRIVCLCGSTRFAEAFEEANKQETLAGKIVLSIGCNMKKDKSFFDGSYTDDELATIKKKLDALHFRKIELAEEILVLNVDGYIGESTAREIAHAKELGKLVRYWHPEPEGE